MLSGKCCWWELTIDFLRKRGITVSLLSVICVTEQGWRVRTDTTVYVSWGDLQFDTSGSPTVQRNSNCCPPYNATVPYLAQEYTYHTFKECLYTSSISSWLNFWLTVTSGSSVYEHSVYFLSEWTDYQATCLWIRSSRQASYQPDCLIKS